jgi:hypothetical protein
MFMQVSERFSFNPLGSAAGGKGHYFSSAIILVQG